MRGILALATVLLAGFPLLSAAGNVPVYVDGALERLEPEARLLGESVQLPVRAFCERRGWKVDWDEAGQMAVVTLPGERVVIPAAAGQYVEGCLFVPVRLLAAALGMTVRWDGVSSAACLSRPLGPRGGPAEAPPEARALSGAINLVRRTFTSVTASGVNGRRPLDNEYYGVLNAFDTGTNLINDLNYTYWLAEPGEGQWIEVQFDQPVTVGKIHVAGNAEYVANLYLQGDSEEARGRTAGDVTFASPVPGVTRLRLTFFMRQHRDRLERLAQDDNTCRATDYSFLGVQSNVQVDDLRILGFPPPGADLTECAPRLYVPPAPLPETKPEK